MRLGGAGIAEPAGGEVRYRAVRLRSSDVARLAGLIQVAASISMPSPASPRAAQY